MKQRLYILLIALLSLATEAKAQDITTLEFYDEMAYTDELGQTLDAIYKAGELDKTPIGNLRVRYSRNGKTLIELQKGKNGITIVDVPTDVTGEDNFKATINKVTVGVTFSVAINKQNFTDATFRNYVSENFDTEKNNTPDRLTRAECNAVKEIKVYNKGITDLKGVEYFTNLKVLWCHLNQLTSLDVSKNTALEELNCGDNQLIKLDISNNTALANLTCSYNQLTSLDVSGCTALTEQLLCSHNQLTELDVSKNTALEMLYCDNNQLTKLDVSKNTALKTLYCDNNQLTTLDVSKNTALTVLSVSETQLSTLDVSKNTALTRLYFYNNPLKTIDLSKNTALETLCCQNTQLNSLDLSNKKKLEFITCYSNNIRAAEMEKLVNGLPEVKGSMCVYNAAGDGNEMTPAQVETAKKKGWNVQMVSDGDWIDFTGFVIVDELNFPDKNFRDYVTTNFDTEKSTPGRLTKAECEHATKIEVNNFSNPDKQIESLKGVEHFTKLTKLECTYNKLTELDLSKNTALEYLSCYGNQLKELDVSKNTKLTELYCNKNQLSSLDVSKNTALLKLGFSENQLTKIDLSNNTALTTLDCQNNQLTSLDVSDHTALTGLYIRNNPLTTLKASGCTSLESLSCSDNKTLTTIDASGCTALTEIYCYNLQLTALDVSGCTALTYLHCYYNQLTSLDVSDCTALTKLYCNDNLLTELDLSNNKALMSLSCYQNQLTTLVISYNPLWEYLACYNNRIKGKDMWNIVNSLPILPEGTTNYFDPIDISSSEEQNVITALQVAAANAKGWAVMAYDGHSFVDYDGIHIPGDANGDGEVTANDVNAVCAYILGLLPDDQPFDEESADVSNDGTVDIVDVTRLIELVKVE